MIRGLNMKIINKKDINRLSIGESAYVSNHAKVEKTGKNKFRMTLYGRVPIFVDDDGTIMNRKVVYNNDCLYVRNAYASYEFYPDKQNIYNVNNGLYVCSDEWFIRCRNGNGWFVPNLLNDSYEYSEKPDGVIVTRTKVYDIAKLIIKHVLMDGMGMKHEVYLINTTTNNVVFDIVRSFHGKFTFNQNGSCVDLLNEHGMMRENLYAEFKNGTVKGIYWNAETLDVVFGSFFVAMGNVASIDPYDDTFSNPSVDGFIVYDSAASYTRTTDSETLPINRYSSKISTLIYRSYVEWDISDLQGLGIESIDNVSLGYHGANAADEVEIKELATRPSTATNDASGNQSIYDGIGNGTQYVGNWTVTASTNQEIDLGTDAETDLYNNISNGWFAIGIKHQDEDESIVGGESTIYSEEYASVTPAPTLNVDYTAISYFDSGLRIYNGNSYVIVGKSSTPDDSDVVYIWNGTEYVRPALLNPGETSGSSIYIWTGSQYKVFAEVT